MMNANPLLDARLLRAFHAVDPEDNALMQDLSEAGKNVMPKYPDSGTVGRGLAIASGPAAAGFMTSLVTTGLGVGAGALAMAPYTHLGQKSAAALLAKRPAIADPIASGVRSASPIAGAAVSPALLKMLVEGLD